MRYDRCCRKGLADLWFLIKFLNVVCSFCFRFVFDLRGRRFSEGVGILLDNVVLRWGDFRLWKW